MKFLALTSLATGAFAGLMIRDLATITGVMSGIGTDLDGLDTAVKGFTSDPTNILTASNKLIADLKAGKTKVDPLPELSLTDALGLQTPAKSLQTKGDALLADFKAKRDALAAAGLCGPALQQATSINTASQDLIKSIVGKVPADAQSIAEGIVAPLIKDLQDAQDAFSPANCKDSSSPPPPTTTKGVPPPPTTTKGAPPPTTTKGAPPPTTTKGAPPPTSTVAPPPGTGTCPAGSTVTATVTDSKGCTATPTCTKTPPVTVTVTTKACPVGSKLPM
ncbi:hypothetical protein QQS21_010212 [Conoideocrella luteorostrata]|uniref:Cell wall protein n=1 Tax=Conoideocrella luteorostrata TaxID=1105319 RepID=A0AAJ0FPM0_9HYPO|nr:hypothetical protein QQS21_010212 [Conoideocrella luteorostrata]